MSLKRVVTKKPVDLNDLTDDDLQELANQIKCLQKQRGVHYRLEVRIKHDIDRADDMCDPQALCDHLYDYVNTTFSLQDGEYVRFSVFDD